MINTSDSYILKVILLHAPPPIPPIAKNQSDPMGVKAPVSCLQFKYCCPLRFSKPRAED